MKTGSLVRVVYSLQDLRSLGIDLHPMSLPRMWKAGRFPKPVKFGSRNAWLASEIEAWIAARKQERDAR